MEMEKKAWREAGKKAIRVEVKKKAIRVEVKKKVWILEGY